MGVYWRDERHGLEIYHGDALDLREVLSAPMELTTPADYAAEMATALADARELLQEVKALVEQTVPDDALRWLFLHEADEHESILTLVRWARRVGMRVVLEDAEVPE